MPYLEHHQAHLWYQDTGGDGAAVVFVHAFSGNADAWTPQTPAFTASGYRCITYDRRGWGRSQDALAEGSTAFPADDLQGLVEQLNLGAFHLISTGAGGTVAIDYAATYPTGLRSLIISCWGGGPLQEDPRYLPSSKRYGQMPDFQALPVWFRELGPTYRAIDPDGVDRWLEIEQSSRHREGNKNPNKVRNHFTLELLGTLDVPTLVIASDADLYAAPPRMSALADHIAGSEFAVVPEAGHAAHWEQPAAWNRLVLAFIQSH